jgi:hypothetical protein
MPIGNWQLPSEPSEFLLRTSRRHDDDGLQACAGAQPSPRRAAERPGATRWCLVSSQTTAV